MPKTLSGTKSAAMEESTRVTYYSAIVAVGESTGNSVVNVVKLSKRLKSPSKYPQEYRSFSGKGFKILLNYPAYCEIEHHAEGVILSYLPLNIHGAGKTLKEAERDFADDLRHDYEHSVGQNDERSTDYAKKIKYTTLSLVKEVVHGKS